jgi:integrase
VTRYALQLAPLVFVRPGELRKAEWNEIDLEAGEWRIPAERMKMKAKHIVPLSSQAVATLRALQPLTGKGHYVFPGARSRERCMSENTVHAQDAVSGWHDAHCARAAGSDGAPRGAGPDAADALDQVPRRVCPAQSVSGGGDVGAAGPACSAAAGGGR